MKAADKAYNDIMYSVLPEKIQEENVKLLVNAKDYDNRKFIMDDRADWNWHYKARVLLLRGYPRVKDVIPELYYWLQDINWPGADVIMELLSTLPRDVLVSSFEEATEKAIKARDYSWMEFLYMFAEDNNITESDFKNKEFFRHIEDFYKSLD